MGNERIIADELNLDSKICLINTYLHTNKQDSQHAYRECLDLLHDIVTRYEHSHQIVLCGDLNGTLLSARNNKHDCMLKDFVNEHMLSMNGHSKLKPTFYHFNGIVTSQIDYILTNDVSLIETYSAGDRESTNVSSHVPVQAKLRVKHSYDKVCSVTKSGKQVKQILLWKKIDIDSYLSEVDSQLSMHTNSNPESTVNLITKCLTAAAQKSVPSKTVKFKEAKQRVSKEVLGCLKKVKETYSVGGFWKA